jgi:hypothetical protein
VKTRFLLTAAFIGALDVAAAIFLKRPAVRQSGPDPARSVIANSGAVSEQLPPEGQKRLGPFSLSGQNYYVVLEEKKRAPGSTGESGTTVVSMEVRKSSGEVEFRRTFPYSPDSDSFSDAWSVSAALIKGSQASGLLISYDVDSEPSAPEPESTSYWQLFGIAGGKLKAFSAPISVQGDRLSDADSTSDTLEFKVWAHHFRVVFPFHVDWAQGVLSPAQHCDGACQYKVLPEDLSARGDLTFIRVCDKAGQACESPERVIVKRDSRIEVIAAQLDARWSVGSSGPQTTSADSLSDAGEIVIPEDVWLKVRVDGKEGWIHDDEDFRALGLPFEQ